MSKSEFADLISNVTGAIAGQTLNGALQDHLNTVFPVTEEPFNRLAKLCAEGEQEGWLMQRAAGGIKFGRAIKPGTTAGRFSVDVVRMKNVKGPHHVHSTGEIGAIFPIEGSPKFDGIAQGWYVYPPGSDHHPTVTDGDAYVLYLLPDGAIEFTGK